VQKEKREERREKREERREKREERREKREERREKKEGIIMSNHELIIYSFRFQGSDGESCRAFFGDKSGGGEKDRLLLRDLSIP
jgi:hypothetical protein